MRRYPLHPVLVEWESDLRADSYAPTYIRSTTDAVDRICRDQQLTDPRSLTTAHVRAFFNGRPLSTGSRLQYLVALRAFATWAKIPDPTRDIRRPPARRRKAKPISESDRVRVLDYLKVHNRRAYAIAVLALYGGLRACEIGRLRREHILLDPLGEGGIITVVNGKGGKTGDVHVTPIVIDILKGLPEQGPLFDLTPNTVTVTFRYWARKAGVRASLHQCRHWFITWTWRSSKDPFATRRQARHEQLATTEGYIESEQGDERAAAARLPGTEPASAPAPVAGVNIDALRQRMTEDPEGFLDRVAAMIAERHALGTQLNALRRILQPEQDTSDQGDFP